MCFDDQDPYVLKWHQALKLTMLTDCERIVFDGERCGVLDADGPLWHVYRLSIEL